MMVAKQGIASYGHKLGQIVGDWHEQYVALPMLSKISEKLGLFLASHFVACEKPDNRMTWKDLDGNEVNYDFVMELGGTPDKRGVPVAFFESFWRSGTRHSKDKARDDVGKLVPMRHTSPTVRMLGLFAAGDFTEPARTLVRSRGIELLHIPKATIVRAWQKNGLNIDYDDKAVESEKKRVFLNLDKILHYDADLLKNISASLFQLVGNGALTSFEHMIISKLSATPQEYRLVFQQRSDALCFTNYRQMDTFLTGAMHCPDMTETRYAYEVEFSDGDSFRRDWLTLSELRDCHAALSALVRHLETRC